LLTETENKKFLLEDVNNNLREWKESVAKCNVASSSSPQFREGDLVPVKFQGNGNCLMTCICALITEIFPVSV
jgi:hypothetical protein